MKNDDANCFVFWLIMYHKQGKQSDHGRIFSLQSEINLEGATEPNPLVDVFSHYVCFKRKCIDIVRRNSSFVSPLGVKGLIDDDQRSEKRIIVVRRFDRKVLFWIVF